MATKTPNQVPPSPAYSSDSNDQEFMVTAEMMVDGEDYENTIDDEEDMDEVEDEDELADLQKEGEMPLEELLKMYYNNPEESKEDASEDKSKDEDKPPEKNEEPKIVEEINQSSIEMPVINDNGENFDPFFNQRITRGLAALNSQYFDDDFSSDEDYQPATEADDWKKEIQIGEDYQAMVTDSLCPYQPKEKTSDTEDKLLWTPSVVSEPQLRRYLTTVYKLTDTVTPTSDRDDEQALFTLLQMRDVNKALNKRQEQEREPPGISLWSELECQNFEHGLRVFGKDFRLIQKNKVQSRSVAEIVQFYYLWKKTERHDAFITQTKLGRRKYTIPGIADMMGRFIEENESVLSSRSASPSVDQNINNTETNNIKQEIGADKAIIKQENNYDSYSTQTNQSYYGSNDFSRTFRQNSSSNSTESWRTSPNPISIGSVN